MRLLLAALLAGATAVIGFVVIVHELTLRHPSRTIEALAAGLFLGGLALLALLDDLYAQRRRG